MNVNWWTRNRCAVRLGSLWLAYREALTMRLLIAAVVVSCTVIASRGGSAQSQGRADKRSSSEGMGAWVLSATESDFGGGTAPKSQVFCIITNTPTEVAWTIEAVESDDKTYHASWRGAPDGTFRPVDNGSNNEMNAIRRSDSGLLIQIRMKDGTTYREDIRFSEDEETLTDRIFIPSAKGERKLTYVFHKQSR